MKIRRRSIKAGYAVDDILWVLDGDDNTWKTWGSAGPKKKSMSKEELIDALNAEGNNYIDVLITKNGENPDDYGYTEKIKGKFVKSGCTKKSVNAAKNIKKKPRNVQVYFWHNNAYNAVVMTDGEYWIVFDDSFDGIDLYDEDVITELKSYIKTTDFNDFDDMYNQFANDENVNSPVVGDNFGGEFDTSELTKVGTIYEGKANSSRTKKSVKASTYNSIELTFISPDLETGRSVVDKAREIGGFGSTWNETKWVHIDVPSTQSVDNVDDLIDYAQSVGVYLNRPSAKLLDAWADSKLDRVLRGCTEMSVKSTKSINAATDITNLKILTSGIAYVEVYEDSYEQGEGEFSDSWEFRIDTQFDNSQEMIDDISDSVGIFTKNLSDYVFLDGSLQTDATVNEFNEIPTDEEVEAWTRGEKKLYVAHLWVGLEVGGGSHQMTDDEAEAFGFSLY